MWLLSMRLPWIFGFLKHGVGVTISRQIRLLHLCDIWMRPQEYHGDRKDSTQWTPNTVCETAVPLTWARKCHQSLNAQNGE